MRPIKRAPKGKPRCLNSGILGDFPAPTANELSSIALVKGAYVSGWTTHALLKPLPKESHRDICRGEDAYYLLEDNKRAAELEFIGASC